MATLSGLRFVAFSTALACCGGVHAQTLQPPATGKSSAGPALRPGDMRIPDGGSRAQPQGSSDDMAIPDDLGAPLAETAIIATPPLTTPRRLSVDSPIGQIASSPQGKAALERTLPGLCERPEYSMFKSLSLRRLAAMSSGRITKADLQTVQSQLARAGPAGASPVSPSHGMFYPIAQTAGDSVRYGGRQIKQLSHAIYHRVTLVIAAL